MNLKTTESVVDVPLVAISVDRKWNVRKSLGDDCDGIGEHEFSNLVVSLKRSGQDTPIVVRPIVPSTTDRFSLVAGFRRYAAFERIYSEGGTVPGVTQGCIQAFIREMNDVRARVMNGRENTGRNGLNTPDKAFLVHELSDEHGLNYHQICEELALSDCHVRRLHQLYKRTVNLRYVDKDTDVSVFDHWRTTPGKVTVTKMYEIVDASGSDQTRESMYRDLLTPQVETPVNNNPYQPRSRLYGKQNGVSNLGYLLGKLEASGTVVVQADAGAIIEASGKGQKGGNLRELCEIFETAFKKGKGT